ncbi:hypothetical protein LEP1GSC083_3507 [Leptospira interrogans serovar Pyrogenes str. L0374]|uniref:Uncharacterized protein n=4 Tax=Leptospira interrogans TaxID=173 RepID=A0A829CVE5_LEPIR|nr:hypothetical protein LEP1GSC087_4278 [Leptospira interrogans serovar Bataviae str. L1111]EMF40612.1 hypothetical protein LEP1GSC067_0132 [Leptospira interrogans serovar Lora str. TE 1992]EMN07961.1 hypothetical protein LEP1GSC053_3138 [Leptospira interrogans serovar Muenchen str. Brem 129]EMN31834.1 hypothetical protein LEP1GSC083_3507 [Leptospira interrogans serovar Pyrogenes str. L0374]EMN36308.1 hypothetical protein LEP1GSC084_4743 [Leptospira interrogans serovar Medanensis str. L0448]EM
MKKFNFTVSYKIKYHKFLFRTLFKSKILSALRLVISNKVFEK